MSYFGSLGFGFIYPSTRSWGSTPDPDPAEGEYDVLPAITDYTIVYDFNKTDIITQESVINGHKEIIVKGNRQLIKVDFHNCDTTMMTNLLASLGKVVRCRPHTDNEDCEFLANIIKVKPYYEKNNITMDACIVEIESQELTELVVAD